MVGNEITGSTTVAATKDQVHSELDGEAVILHLCSGTYYGLNAAGAHIWHMLQQPRRVVEILAEMLETFEVESNQCESDLMALLQRLSDEGLLEVVHEADI
jgi:hypothetical protein